MKKISLLLFICLFGENALAQHSSSDFKDAATTGPFPLYIGLGYANSFRNQDLVDVGRAFSAFYTNGLDNPRTRMYGMYAFAGFSFIPKDWPISLVLEVKHLFLRRTFRVDPGTFVLTSNQTTLGLGLRWALFPLVVQAQFGPILRYDRNYNFRLATSERSFKRSSGSQGWSGLVRIGILDPAGTEGGLGMYVEAGFNWLGKDDSNREITGAIRAFDNTYAEVRDGKGRYGYLSVGLLLPIAIRIR